MFTRVGRPKLEGSCDPIEQLVREHGNIATLLVLLDSYFAAMKAGDEVDDSLLLDAMTYLTDYVDGFHHAKEQLAMEALAERSGAVRAAGELTVQHRRIRESGLQVRDSLERALHDEPVSRQGLADTGFAYAAEMRRNMELEEASVFPVLAEALDDGAWSRIDAKLGPQADPLFGETVQDQYVSLFRELTARFGCEDEARFE